MGKHRKQGHYRRILIAVVTVGAVGVPSVALACTDWHGSGESHSDRAGAKAAEHRWSSGDRWHDWHGDGGEKPTSAPSKTPTAAASTPKATTPKPPRTTAPKPRATTPSSTTRSTAPAPKASASPSPSPTTASPSPTSPSTPKPNATASGAVKRVVELVNAERGKAGCSPLKLNATLSKAAQAHSEDMAAHRNMSHTGSDGSSPGDRITRAGYTWSSYGENVAYGYATPEQVMAGWMSSPGHKANILNCGFKEIGVGLAQPGSYWTQDFGTAR
ncbi:CAP domain-containing protein [Streptomyces sp. SID2888]|nr:CAP domain-containing protein [Streptomyces sp. SID2888]MYV48115.1 CAP domain-containing protein [Streptomyces sp. SID2888]